MLLEEVDEGFLVAHAVFLSWDRLAGGFSLASYHKIDKAGCRTLY
jgi:hypothetical protein